FTLKLLDPLLQVGVLFDEPGELRLDEIEELIDLILVVAALTDRRFAERDVVHISWSQPHVGSPRVCGEACVQLAYRPTPIARPESFDQYRLSRTIHTSQKL